MTPTTAPPTAPPAAPERMVGITELGRMLGITKQGADKTTRRRGFPPPRVVSLRGRLWSLADVRAWAADRGRTLNDPHPR